MQTSRSSVVVVDAYALRRAGLAALIEPWASAAGLLIVSVSPQELNRQLVDGIDPVFVIFSVGGASLNADSPSQWAAEIAQLLPQVPCLVLSDRAEPEEAILAARLGEQAFMSTNVEPGVALRAFAFVLGGGTFFPREALLQASARPEPVSAAGDEMTPRQAQVLARLRLGKSNKLIARELDVQESTVKVHVREIMRKLGACNRTEAVSRASQFRPADPILVPKRAADASPFARAVPLPTLAVLNR